MPNDSTLPSRHIPQIYEVFTPAMAATGGFMPVVDPAIRISKRFRTYVYSSALRQVYITTEDHIVLLFTSNRRIVELTYQEFDKPQP
jgi:hypothetical protein